MIVPSRTVYIYTIYIYIYYIYMPYILLAAGGWLASDVPVNYEHANCSAAQGFWQAGSGLSIGVAVIFVGRRCAKELPTASVQSQGEQVEPVVWVSETWA
jgi:hypothetical protein